MLLFEITYEFQNFNIAHKKTLDTSWNYMQSLCA